MISKFTRHLGPKCRGDHSPRIRFPILVACCTSPRMEVLSVPRLVVFGCSYPFTQDIGPGLSFYAIGAQGKIGPHRYLATNNGIWFNLEFSISLTIPWINSNSVQLPFTKHLTCNELGYKKEKRKKRI